MDTGVHWFGTFGKDGSTLLSGPDFPQIYGGEAFSLGVAAASSTPIEAESRPGHPAAVLIGDALDGAAGDGGLAAVRRLCAQGRPHALTALDGYYGVCTADEAGVVTVASDLLGLFPVYYTNSPRAAFSSSPFFFKTLPGFSPQLDVQAFAELLLLGFIPSGRTLWRGVRRLMPGRYLRWTAADGLVEKQGDWIRAGDTAFGIPFNEAVERTDHAMQNAVRRPRSASGETQMLLSGGLDSRLLAGYLAKAHGAAIGVTQGEETDYEYRCARRVAESLRWKIRRVPADPQRLAQGLAEKIRMEHLVHGLSTPYFRQIAPALSAGTHVYSGAHGDSALGFAAVAKVRAPEEPHFSFEGSFAYLNRCGFSAGEVRSLVRPEILGRSLEAALEELRAYYGSLPGAPFQRAWLFDLAMADRFQVGFIAPAVAAGAWPVLPFLNRALLECAGSLPYPFLASRRIQSELLCRKFPRLAELPLDRNSDDTSPAIGLRRALGGPLDLRTRLRVLPAIAAAKFQIPWKRAIRKWLGGDRRFYHRTFDLRQPGWHEIRRTADEQRASVSAILDPKALDSILPLAGRPIAVQKGIVDSYKYKTLMGFLLWSKNYL